jgi:hypothetical protein
MPITETTDAHDCTPDTLAILARLRTGWRPRRRDLAGTDLLDRWRLFSPGPYVLQGWIGMTMKSGIVFAFDVAWVRFIDRWARLGKTAVAQPLPSNDAVMRCALAALAGRDEAGEIGAEARALAERSREAGLYAAAYLLDMAAYELNDAR